MTDSYYLGIDCGSVSLNLVLSSLSDGRPLSLYRRTRGRPLETFVDAVAELREMCGDNARIRGVLATGSARELFSQCLGVPAINEITAHAIGAFRVDPRIRTIIEVGGQDSKFIRIEPSDDGDSPRIVSFRMNEICAAGTGAFLDEQAGRLKIPIESFAEIAARSTKPAPIAGRCAVFAKTDMIHQAQEGMPLPDILLGTAYALARNYLGTLVRGDALVPMVSLQGGVMANAAVVNAFRDLLGPDPESVIVPPLFTVLGALGCAALAEDAARPVTLEELAIKARSAPRPVPSRSRSRPPALVPGDEPDRPEVAEPLQGYERPFIMGLDVGSVSVKGVVTDRRGVILREDYRLSEGRPLDGLDAVIEALTRDGPAIDLCAVTGSGRSLAGRLLRADLIVNEITAQYTAAVHYDPETDTIIEIGGQDSKWIALEQGALKDFEMNRVCAAGTGSFIMEQADRLDLPMGPEFSDCAFASHRPSDLGSRCTVFMESDLIHHQNNGASRADLAAGVCLSIVRNYLERTANHKRIGDRVVFLGGVAASSAVRAAFEQETGKAIVTPGFHKISGALGAALNAAQALEAGKIVLRRDPLRPRGLAGIPRDRFSCRRCPNQCAVEKYELPDRVVFSGGRCDRWEADERHAAGDDREGLFGFRTRLIEEIALSRPVPDRASHLESPAGGSKSAGPWGMVRSPQFYEWFPFWKGFLNELGIELVIAPRPNREQFERGVRFLHVETCLPMKVMAGQIHALVEAGIRTIFHPTLLSEPPLTPRGRVVEHCPYIQSSSRFFRGSWEVEWHEPIVGCEFDPDAFRNEHLAFAEKLGLSNRTAARAFERGMEERERFSAAIEGEGEAFVESLREGDRAVVVLGKPYHTSDAFLNMNLGALLRNLGVKALPGDLLPVERYPARSPIAWKYQLETIAAARAIATDPRLFPVMISFFGCGPDPFTVRHVTESLKGKPLLLLEMDEHSSKAGILTRLEAFLDRVSRCRPDQRKPGRPIRTATEPHRGRAEDSEPARITRPQTASGSGAGKPRVDRIYIPHFSVHAYAFAAAARSMGIDAQVLPRPDEESVRLSRPHLVGGECHPYALVLGDYLRLAESLPPEAEKRSIFCIPAFSACRLGQYPVYVEKVRRECGRSMRVVGDLSQAMTAFGISKKSRDEVFLHTWEGLTAYDMLMCAYLRVRPHAPDPRAAERRREKALDALFSSLCRRRAEEGLDAALHELDGLAPPDPSPRPLIAITGDYYTRVVSFANNGVYDEIERLGGTVLFPPTFTDGLKAYHLWGMTGRSTDLRSEELDSGGSLYASMVLSEMRLKEIAREWAGDRSPLDLGGTGMKDPAARHPDDRLPPGIAAPLATVLDSIDHGAHAILNLITLNCSYGTVVTAALNRALKGMPHIPMLTLVFDGLKKTNEKTRLEAFMEQVHAGFRGKSRYDSSTDRDRLPCNRHGEGTGSTVR
jgi:predicted CoA-substrate-specific enzyme activase